MFMSERHLIISLISFLVYAVSAIVLIDYFPAYWRWGVIIGATGFALVAIGSAIWEMVILNRKDWEKRKKEIAFFDCSRKSLKGGEMKSENSGDSF